MNKLFVFISVIISLCNASSLVLVGGALDDNNTDIYGKIISLAGGSSARIGVITAASDPADSQANGEYYSNLFMKYGAADAEWIPIDLNHTQNANDPTVIQQINSMTGFFFGGGDQSRIITCFYQKNRQETAALTAIRKIFTAGGVISGSSAGTAVQVGKDSTGPLPMFAGGESYQALRDGPYEDGDNTPDPDDLTYDPNGGIGFFNYGLLDTHFSERGRQGREVRLAYFSYVDFAFGMDQNTAIVVTDVDSPSVEIEALGESGVFIFDLTGASSAGGDDWSIQNVSVTYITSGDVYSPTKNTVTFASWKSPIVPNNQPSMTTNDIFSSPDNSDDNGRKNPREFANVCVSLVQSTDKSTYGTTYESGPEFKVVLAKTSQTVSYQGTSSGVTYTSFQALKMKISGDGN